MSAMTSRVFRGGKRFFGHYAIDGIECIECSFINGVFGYNGSWEKGNQDSLCDAVISNAKVHGCLVGPAIVRRSIFSNICGDLLICWGTLFDRVKILGRFDALMLNSFPQFGLDEKGKERYRERRGKFYRDVEWALDISKAEFSDFCIKSDAVPLSKLILDPETQFIVDVSAVRGQVDVLPVSSYTKIMISQVLIERGVECLLVAPKLDRDLFGTIMRDADVLRDVGCIKFE